VNLDERRATDSQVSPRSGEMIGAQPNGIGTSGGAMEAASIALTLRMN